MFSNQRRDQIASLVQQQGQVSVKELADLFNLSEDSIRKDLADLESQGILKRTYGGAISSHKSLLINQANQRRLSHVLAKRNIAQAAANLLRPNRLFFLDISSSAVAIALALQPANYSLKIITNMVDVLAILAKNPQIELYFAGGLINQSRDGFSDVLNLEFMSKFRPDIAFIGASGVDLKKNSLSVRNPAEGVHKARIIELSKETYVMVEGQKFGVEGNYQFSTIDKVSGLITEKKLSEEESALAEKLGVKIISA
ncbi:MAG: DeoR/GlpR transcriptional regulator [Quinella sp. 3Q1]|nr:DeoR/GlpR transcriptional regulator [Quinella sp. 3Q1]MBR6888411.1 DeoR/GlpR transcriptional regulator [Selenomonadaceae bacterium]